MKTVLCLSVLFAYATAVQHLAVSDAIAARVDAQAWRVDRLTKQFQAISDLADGAKAAAKAAGDTARHLMSNYLDATDKGCLPNTRRCGKSAQCISFMAFCDGVNDCKNHYDENPERCVVPFAANTTYIGYPVFDHCYARGTAAVVDFSYRIISVRPDKVYRTQQKVKMWSALSTIVHGKRQTIGYVSEGVYCMGTRRLIQQALAGSSIQVVGQWDGVNNDIYTWRLYRISSGDLCGIARNFKV